MSDKCLIELDRKDSQFPELKTLLEKAGYNLQFIYDEGKYYFCVSNKKNN
jgi:hypothetical protein